MGYRGFKCVKCGRYQAGERGGLCLDCEQELKDEQRKRQARLTRFYHTWERRWKALEKVKRAGGEAWFDLMETVREMEPYDFFRFFGRRRRWQCFECLKEGTKFVAEHRRDAVEHLVNKHSLSRENAEGRFDEFVDELVAYLIAPKIQEGELHDFIERVHDELNYWITTRVTYAREHM